MGQHSPLKIASLKILMAITIVLGGWTDATAQATPAAKEKKACDQAGLTLPAGFCASVFADNLGRTRHITVAPNGDVYVNSWSSSYTDLKNAPGGYIVALRDTDRDGKADTIERFGTVHQDGKPGGGTGIGVHRDALYVEDNGIIVRYRLTKGQLVPKGKPDIILSGLWTERVASLNLIEDTTSN